MPNQTGAVLFRDDSSAGSASITNNAGALVFRETTRDPDFPSLNLSNSSAAVFDGRSSAGSATITNNGGTSDSFLRITGSRATHFIESNNAALAFFAENATAGSSTIVNNNGAHTVFFDSSTAGSATITTNSGSSVQFRDASSGGTARFINNAGGTIDISALTAAGTQAGSIEGAGTVRLGGRQLTLGGNNRSTEISGVIADGGVAGGRGGSLVKTGTGTLTLSGVSTYTGATTVSAGTLLVNGSIVSAVQVNIGARLGGTGRIGSATIAGTLSPGTSIGTLNVTGNIIFAAGSTYEMEVDAAGASDRVLAGGTATIQGGTVSVLAQAGAYAPSTRYTILTAQGGLSGIFSTVTSNFAFLTPTLSYDPNNAYLTLTRNDISFPDVALTFNQTGAATGSEPLGAGNPVFDALVQLTNAQAPVAFDQLSGEIHASARSVLIDDSRFVREAALDRRHGGRGAWLSGYGSWGEIEGDGNAAAVDRDANGLFAGIDLPIGGGWTAGIAGGYSRASFDAEPRASEAEVDSWHFAAHVAGRFGGLGVAAGGAVAWHDIETARAVGFPGFGDTATARYDGRTLQAFAEVGYAIPLGTATVEPFAGVAHVDVEADGFSESGGPAALTGREGSDAVTFTTLGVRGSARLGRVSVAGSLGWRHAFGLDPSLTTLAFNGGAGTPFTVAGAPIDDEALVAEAGIEIGLGGRAALGFAYSGQIAGHGQDHGARVVLSIPF